MNKETGDSCPPKTDPLPRDTSRFRTLSTSSRPPLKENATETLSALSSSELISSDETDDS